jgi:hypothetical protein
MASPIDTMEILLNTIWFLVSIGAFGYLRPARYRATPPVHRPGGLLAVLALASALLLLFPVISLTDDLHAEQYPMEDSSRSVMKARNLGHTCMRASRFPFLAAITGGPNQAVGLNLVFGTVVLIESHPSCLTPVSTRQGRSPPSTP